MNCSHRQASRMLVQKTQMRNLWLRSNLSRLRWRRWQSKKLKASWFYCLEPLEEPRFCQRTRAVFRCTSCSRLNSQSATDLNFQPLAKTSWTRTFCKQRSWSMGIWPLVPQVVARPWAKALFQMLLQGWHQTRRSRIDLKSLLQAIETALVQQLIRILSRIYAKGGRLRPGPSHCLVPHPVLQTCKQTQSHLMPCYRSHLTPRMQLKVKQTREEMLKVHCRRTPYQQAQHSSAKRQSYTSKIRPCKKLMRHLLRAKSLKSMWSKKVGQQAQPNKTEVNWRRFISE